MKKYILIAVVVIGILIGSVSTVKALNLYYIQVGGSTEVASSTSTFVIGGNATTTKTIVSDGFSQVSWLVALASSTTPPTLCWKNQYSNNNTDWYTEDASSTLASTNLAHSPIDKQECWTYASTTSGTNTATILSTGSDGKTLFMGRKIVVPNLDTQYTRTVFSINTGVSARLDVRGSIKNSVVISK